MAVDSIDGGSTTILDCSSVGFLADENDVPSAETGLEKAYSSHEGFALLKAEENLLLGQKPIPPLFSLMGLLRVIPFAKNKVVNLACSFR